MQQTVMLNALPAGKELIVDLMLPGDLFGLVTAVENLLQSFIARTQLKTRLLMVPSEALLSLLESFPNLYKEFVRIISSRLAKAHTLSRRLARKVHESPGKRFITGIIWARLYTSFFKAVYNYRCQGIFWGLMSEGVQKPSIKLTRQELANLSGSTVETAIRVTKQMEHENNK